VARSSKSDAAGQVPQFVEEFALMCEQGGMPRIAGKLLAWLLVSDAAQQDAEQLAAAVQASKASVSTMTRYLIDRGLVERCAVPGDRRVHFRMRPIAWSQQMRERMRSIGQLRSLAERALALVRDKSPAQRARAEEMVAFYSWWERELPGLFERWEQERPRRRGA